MFARQAVFIFGVLLLSSLGGVLAQDATAVPPALISIDQSNATHALTLFTADIHSDPNMTSPVVITLPQDERLSILERSLESEAFAAHGYESSEWLRVSAESGQEGYIWSGWIGLEYTSPDLPGITFFAQPQVTERDLNLIATGTQAGLEYIDAHLGGGVTTTIKVFNIDRSNTGLDSCCMAANERSEPGARYMIRHRAWQSMSDVERLETASREMMRLWQAQRGQCNPHGDPPIGFWLGVSMADYLSWESLVEAGLASAEMPLAEAKLMYHGNNYELAQPDWFKLWESAGNYAHFNSHNGYQWSYLAVAKLVQDYGEDVLVSLCHEAFQIGGDSSSAPVIFQRVVGIPVTEFYNSLPAFFALLGLDEGAGAVVPNSSVLPPSPIHIVLADVTQVVALSDANLRSGAETSANVVTSLAKGSRATILESAVEGANVSIGGYESDQWLHVRTEQAQEGYVWSGLVGLEITDPNIPGITILVQPGVRENDVNDIAAGVWASLNFQNQTFGTTLNATTIRVYNTDGAETGENSCCLGMSRDGLGPRFFVRHPVWQSMTDMGKVSSAAHELAHRWQEQLQCIGLDRQPLGFWMPEGMAEWVAIQSMVDAGWTTQEQSLTNLILFMNQSFSPPEFAYWESPDSAGDFNPNNGYNWSAMAITKLVEDHGAAILLDLCQEGARVGGRYQNFPGIFEAVTDVTPAAFYDTVLDYAAELRQRFGGAAPAAEIEPQPINAEPTLTPPPILIPTQMVMSPDELLATGCIPPVQLQNGGLNVLCLGARTGRDFVFGINRPLDFGSAATISLDGIPLPSDSVSYRIEGLDRPSRDIILSFSDLDSIYVDSGDSVNPILHEIRFCDEFASCISLRFAFPQSLLPTPHQQEAMGCVPPVESNAGALDVVCLGATSIQEIVFEVGHPIDFDDGAGSITLDGSPLPGNGVYFRYQGLDPDTRQLIVRFSNLSDVYTGMGESLTSVTHEIQFCAADDCVSLQFAFPHPSVFLE